MPELKQLHKDAIPAALAKAERYRLLNEPGEAESICLDVLHIEPAHHDALATLILARTDHSPEKLPSSRNAPARATDLIARLATEYDGSYYAGIIRERRAKAMLH